MTGAVPLFHAIDDKQAIMRNVKTGVYKQVKLYERSGNLYAAHGGGFIRLLPEGRTSNPHTKWEGIEAKYVVTPGISTGLRYDAQAVQ